MFVVICMCSHLLPVPLGKLAVTGEFHPNPEVHVWNACTGTGINAFKNIHRRGITSVAFSSSGETIATLGQDPRHSLVRTYMVIVHDDDLCTMSDMFISTPLHNQR